jgi:hypothetical protein
MSKIFSQLLSPVETFAPLTLTAAKPSFRQDVDAEFIVIESADEPIDVFINNGGVAFKMSANDSFKMPAGTRFNAIQLKRRATATLANNTVVFTVGAGDYRRGSVQIAANVTNQSAATLSGANPDVVLVAAAAAVQIVAANSGRRCVRVRNLNDSNSVRVAGVQADATAGRGEYIDAGAAVEIYVTGPLFAASVGGAIVAITEEVY